MHLGQKCPTKRRPRPPARPTIPSLLNAPAWIDGPSDTNLELGKCCDHLCGILDMDPGPLHLPTRVLKFLISGGLYSEIALGNEEQRHGAC